MLNTLDLVLTALAVFISAFGFCLKARRWARGKSIQRTDDGIVRAGNAAERVLGHTDILREPLNGVFHAAIFYIFVLAIGLVVLFHVLPVALPAAGAAIISFILDITGFIALAGVAYFAYRRAYVTGRGFDTKMEDYVLLALLAGILLTGFLMEGVRLRATAAGSMTAPFGTLFSFLVPSTETFLPAAARLFWRTHFFLVLGFIAWLPFSKAVHVVLVPLGYFFRNTAPKGVYTLLDLDNAEEFGANKASDLTWKDLMDLDACVRCGRCQENCPAHLTKKPLSPKKAIQDMKTVMYAADKNPAAPLVNDDITADVVFACTTCRACQENCPAGVEHLDKFIELKRYLVLMEGTVSPEMQSLFKNLERNGNPWGMPASTRGDWAKEQGIPAVGEVEDPSSLDFLFWPGCAGAFDDRYMRVVKRTASLFKKAGLRFAVLGQEETCCGDPGRKAGNEYVYDALARQNVETMNGYGIKTIVTSCPHCYNTLSKDYTQIGGNYAVRTHSEVILDMIASGRLKTVRPLAGSWAYHDSCYLARYNGIEEQPRGVLRSVGLSVAEFERRGVKGFCCGGGGGNMFLEEHSPRMNDTRVAQIIESPEGKGLKGIAVACPFCLTMMIDGTKTYNREDVEVKDIAELVYDAVE